MNYQHNYVLVIDDILSHYYIWDKMIQENINNVLILEDDANKVHNSFIDTINIILKYFS